MKCEDFRKNLYEYHEDAFSRALAREMEAHIRACATCANANLKYERFLRRFSAETRPVEPERDLWPVIKSRIAEKKYVFGLPMKIISAAACAVPAALISVYLVLAAVHQPGKK
jgi:hypothetical protein